MLKIVKKYTHKANLTQAHWRSLQSMREESLQAREICRFWMLRCGATQPEGEMEGENIGLYQKLAPLLIKWHEHELKLCEAQSRLFESWRSRRKAGKAMAVDAPLSEEDREILRRAVAGWEENETARTEEN